MTESILQIIQPISALLLIVAILLQNRSGGLGSVFGSDGNVFYARRGIEQNVFISTIILTATFFSTSFVLFLLN